jgi:hypothetical protein
MASQNIPCLVNSSAGIYLGFVTAMDGSIVKMKDARMLNPSYQDEWFSLINVAIDGSLGKSRFRFSKIMSLLVLAEVKAVVEVPDQVVAAQD